MAMDWRIGRNVAAAAFIAVTGAGLAACSGAMRLAPAPTVVASAETTPVPDSDDAADDPAIWVHPTDASQSLIIGTNKRRGLEVYRLDGSRRQSLDDGRMNNVDLRQGFVLAGSEVTLVAASDRDRNAIALYAFSPERLDLINVADGVRTTGLSEIYGLCMYADATTGKYFVFVNDKDGRYQQHELVATPAGRVATRLVREFRVATQPEGCAADDALGLLYVGEEGAGFCRMDASPDAPTEMTLVDRVGTGHLVADVEGIALYPRADGSGYLVVSSQGDHAFAVYRRQPPNEYLGRFRIADNPDNGVDGVMETDGLDVTSSRLPGPYEAGLLVVQDGYNDAQRANQNFKLIPWSAVERTLGLR